MGIPDGRPWTEPGIDPTVAYVFSCPGRHELEAGHPAAAGTGRHLDMLIAYLTDWGLTEFRPRQQVLVTNAWPGVEYKRHDGLHEDTQAYCGEVLEDWNINRLARELQGVTSRVVCFGDRAAIAIQRLREKGLLKIPFTLARHLSASDLNGHIAMDLDGTPAKKSGARLRQIEVVATEIATAIGKSKYIRSGRSYLDTAVTPPVIPSVATTKRADASKQFLARQLSVVRAAAAVVREVMLDSYPGFPTGCGQDAATVLVLVLESIGIPARAVQGRVSLDRRIVIDTNEPSSTKHLNQWWVESCGVWVDLTYDQFAAGLRGNVPPVSVRRIGKDKHHQEGPNFSQDSTKRDQTITALSEVVVQSLDPTLVDLGFPQPPRR